MRLVFYSKKVHLDITENDVHIRIKNLTDTQEISISKFYEKFCEHYENEKKIHPFNWWQKSVLDKLKDDEKTPLRQIKELVEHANNNPDGRTAKALLNVVRDKLVAPITDSLLDSPLEESVANSIPKYRKSDLIEWFMPSQANRRYEINEHFNWIIAQLMHEVNSLQQLTFNQKEEENTKKQEGTAAKKRGSIEKKHKELVSYLKAQKLSFIVGDERKKTNTLISALEQKLNDHLNKYNEVTRSLNMKTAVAPAENSIETAPLRDSPKKSPRKSALEPANFTADSGSSGTAVKTAGASANPEHNDEHHSLSNNYSRRTSNTTSADRESEHLKNGKTASLHNSPKENLRKSASELSDSRTDSGSVRTATEKDSNSHHNNNTENKNSEQRNITTIEEKGACSQLFEQHGTFSNSRSASPNPLYQQNEEESNNLVIQENNLVITDHLTLKKLMDLRNEVQIFYFNEKNKKDGNLDNLINLAKQITIFTTQKTITALNTLNSSLSELKEDNTDSTKNKSAGFLSFSFFSPKQDSLKMYIEKTKRILSEININLNTTYITYG